MLVESTGRIVFRVNDHRKGTDCPAEIEASPQDVDQQHTFQPLLLIPPIKRETPDENSRVGLVSRKFPARIEWETCWLNGARA
jgi:hypothetical protein